VIELVYLSVLLFHQKKEQVLSWIEEETLVCAKGMILKWLHGIIIFSSPRAEKEKTPPQPWGKRLTHSLISRVKALIQSQWTCLAESLMLLENDLSDSAARMSARGHLPIFCTLR